MEKIATIRKREILESFYLVISKKGIEGSSIARIARAMGVVPGLITHYFKTKEEMTLELVDFMLDKYEEPYFYKLDEITDVNLRLSTLLDALFGLERVRFIDNGAFYSCYSLTYRNRGVQERFERMYRRFRALLVKELGLYMDEGIIKKTDARKAADFIITIMEGLGYYERMLDADRYRELCGQMKEMVISFLKP
jgi:AcrR family transcriptional regulator